MVDPVERHQRARVSTAVLPARGHGKTEAVVMWRLQQFWCHYVFMLILLPSFHSGDPPSQATSIRHPGIKSTTGLTAAPRWELAARRSRNPFSCLWSTSSSQGILFHQKRKGILFSSGLHRGGVDDAQSDEPRATKQQHLVHECLRLPLPGVNAKIRVPNRCSVRLFERCNMYLVRQNVGA